MKISLIIPSLNAPTLPSTLRSLRSQSLQPHEILVVGRDAAGTLSDFPDVRFIDTGRPVCAAAARNRGMLEADGELFVFTDADCLPYANWLKQLRDGHESGEMIVGGAVDVRSDNYWTQSDNVSMFHEFMPHWPAGTRKYLPSLNLSVRRTVVEDVGGMDESFPGAAAEDTDWTIRMRKAGYRLYFLPTALVRHAPVRRSWSDVARHWHKLGQNAVRVRLRYAEDLNTPRLLQQPRLLRLLSPLVAGGVTAGIYSHPAFWPHWKSLPAIYATKIAYCFGAAAAVASGQATAPSSPADDIPQLP